jgi:nucleoside-diphosphate-sugar epimerase
MHVFVTGHRGYIGVHLVDVLLKAGHQVTGCDLDLFAGCEFQDYSKPERELIKDVRDLTAQEIAGSDCVVHLAAISNDPMGEVDPSLTGAVNRAASVQLARLAKQVGVPRFLFASSCSVYGKLGEAVLDEHAPLSPLSEYARSKIEAEIQIRSIADASFSPTFLRNATAYGHSPMLRIDLVANNLLAAAHATEEIRIMSDGSPWRPLAHCRDIARAFVAALEAPRGQLHNLAVNVGADSENYQVRDIAEVVSRLVPNANVVYTGEIGHDPRSYRVSFRLMREVLPNFEFEYSLQTGLAELDREMRMHGFGLIEFEGSRFVRLRALHERLDLLKSSAGREAVSLRDL